MPKTEKVIIKAKTKKEMNLCPKTPIGNQENKMIFVGLNIMKEGNEWLIKHTEMRHQETHKNC